MKRWLYLSTIFVLLSASLQACESPKKLQLGDYAWIDANANGLQDIDEEGLEGVTVSLYDSTDALVAQTTSDEDGFYGFSTVSSGDYYLEFTPPERYYEYYDWDTLVTFILTVKNEGQDDLADSDADPDTHKTDLFSFDSTVKDLSRDAGFVPLPVDITPTPTETPSPTPEEAGVPLPEETPALPVIIQQIPGLLVGQPGVQMTPGSFSIWDFPYAGFSSVKAAYTMGDIKIYQGLDVYYQTIADPGQALYVPSDWTPVETIPSIGDYSAFSQSEGSLMGGYVYGNIANWVQFSGPDGDELVRAAQQIMPGVAQSPPPVLELPQRSDYGAADQPLFSQSFTSLTLGNETGQATTSFSTSQAIHLQMEPAGSLSGYACFATIFDNNGDFVMTSWVEPSDGDINLGNSPFAGHFEMVVIMEQLPTEAGGVNSPVQAPVAVLPYDVTP